MKINQFIRPQDDEMNPTVKLLEWLLDKREDVPKDSDAKKLRKKILEGMIVY